MGLKMIITILLSPFKKYIFGPTNLIKTEQLKLVSSICWQLSYWCDGKTQKTCNFYEKWGIIRGDWRCLMADWLSEITTVKKKIDSASTWQTKNLQVGFTLSDLVTLSVRLGFDDVALDQSLHGLLPVRETTTKTQLW